ncbi:hypothetical protein [Cycloclasticus sp.]|uniref:hypothetical protein n=1 Tax=Cycloclasticus sp. TaxID=2024830 RepID=UPI000C0EE63F|nr:hypothetical protein [Cycloclasticus sp.]PHR50894.1 MAG: hypothetical protein COA48_05445 [Cycloclasticus sp.]
MSKPDHVLYVSDQYLSCSDVTKGGFDIRFKLNLDDIEVGDRFTDFLNKNTLGVMSVFIDMMGTEIKQENIPHVMGNDRKLLLERKKKSLFPAADLVWKEHVKREKTGRKDDVYLFIAITLTPAIKNILEILEVSKNKVNGLYSISALQQELSKGLPEFPQSLVISRVLENSRKIKSFRQSFYRNGKLVISRVNNAIDAYSGSSEYDQLFAEIERTYTFLKGSKQLDAGVTLKVISLLTEKETGLLFNHKKNVDIDFGYASFDDVSKNLGLALSKPCRSLPEVLGNLVVSKNLKPHFRPNQLCATYHTDKAKKLFVLGSVIAIISSVLIASGLWYDTNEIRKSIESHKATVRANDQREEQLVKSATVTEVQPKAMKQSVDLYDAINARRHDPEKVLELISRAYEGHKAFEIQKIVWQETGDIDNVEKQGFFTDRLNEPKYIKITVRPSQGLDNRAVLEKLEGFKSSLLKQPEVKTIEQENSAIDVRSSAKLEESFGRKQDLGKAPEFTLVITL